MQHTTRFTAASPRRRASVPCAISCALAGLTLTACGNAGDERAAERQVDAVYETRGIVTSLPEPGNPVAEFRIQHEPIDNFVNKDGVMVGMNAMDMGFPALAPGVSLEGIEVGDKVSFAFDVAWGGDPLWQVVRLSEIDPATELSFGLADPSRVSGGVGADTGEGDDAPEPTDG